MTLSTSVTFERGPVRGAAFDDLDLDAIHNYLSRRVPKSLLDAQLVEQVGLASKSGANLLPTVAGLLLFGRFPQLLHPEWGLSAVRIDGRVISDPVAARADIEGTLREMLAAALDFIGDNTHSIQNQVELGETAEEYPAVAVREALVNALVHRDWNVTARVGVRVFDDRLEIWSPGAPLTAQYETLEELSGNGGVSIPRNPLIAATCRFLGMGEQLGRGLPAMRRAVSEITGQPLAILSSKSDVCVVIPSALHFEKRSS